MAYRLKWKFPEREDDYLVHMSSNNTERTLCGLAFEGAEFIASPGGLQEFIITRRRANCEQCRAIWEFCRSVKSTDFAKTL